MGHGYASDPGQYREIGENISSLVQKYHYEDGMFGQRGSRTYFRVITAEDPLKEANYFYQQLSKGGVERSVKNGKVRISVMSDGSEVSIREVTSTEGSPAVEISIRRSINPGGLKTQKIHFLKQTQ